MKAGDHAATAGQWMMLSHYRQPVPAAINKGTEVLVADARPMGIPIMISEVGEQGGTECMD